MQITTRTAYAITLLVQLKEDEPTLRKQFQKIICRVDSLLPALREHHLIVSYKGRTGGMLLARPLSEISVWDVVEAVESPVESLVGYDNLSQYLKTKAKAINLAELAPDEG